MRITNSMMSDQFLINANDSLNRLAKAQSQVDSNKRIDSIDDDPLATMSSLRARNKLSSLAEYQDSIKTANSSLKENSTEVDSLNSVLQSAYELMSSANSGSKTDSDLAAIRDEMANLRDEVLSISNSSLGTRYLFSGNSSVKPFSVSSSGGHLSYNGIDLTQYALRDETTAQIGGANQAHQQLDQPQNGEATSTLGMLDDSKTTDYQSQEILVPRVLSSLDSMIQGGKSTIYAAQKFGAGINPDHVDALKSAMNTLSDLREKLESANNKESGIPEQIATKQSEIAELEKDPVNNQDAIAKRQEELAALQDKLGNAYSRSEIDNLIKYGQNPAPTLPTTTTYLTDSFSALKSAMSGIQGDMNDSIGSVTNTQLGVENDAVRTIQIGTAQAVKSSLNGLELMGVSVTKDVSGTATTQNSNSTNLYYILDKCVGILNGDLNKSMMGSMVTTLQSAQSQVLSLNTEIGTAQNRLSMISDRYNASELNYSAMQSEAEDADMAQAAVALTTAKTVYNAALAAGAKIIQTSLVDFLR